MSSTDLDGTENSSRKSKSLEEEIAKAAEKLRRLQEQQREALKRDRERNQRAVMELLKSEKLDVVAVEHWRLCIKQIKAMLDDTSHETPTNPPI